MLDAGCWTKPLDDIQPPSPPSVPHGHVALVGDEVGTATLADVVRACLKDSK